MSKIDRKEYPMHLFRIVKVEEREDAYHKNNMLEGLSKTGFGFKLPEVGECFHVGGFRTSIVEEVNESTIKTMNSIYQWEIL